MADLAWEHAAEARAALNAIVTDPEHGAAALSSPRTMSNLLKDLLPDAPREKNLLVAAAEAGLADSLKEHVSQGMDSSTAISLTASSFSARSPLSSDACRWVTGEIAVALGISETNDAALNAPPPGASPLGGVATEISPGYDSYPPGQRTSADRQPAPDSFGSGQDSYSRAGGSAPPPAGSYPGGSAVVSPGQGSSGQGPLGQGPLGQGPLGQGPLGQGPGGQGRAREARVRRPAIRRRPAISRARPSRRARRASRQARAAISQARVDISQAGWIPARRGLLAAWGRVFARVPAAERRVLCGAARVHAAHRVLARRESASLRPGRGRGDARR